jgi:hypothetical protein
MAVILATFGRETLIKVHWNANKLSVPVIGITGLLFWEKLYRSSNFKFAIEMQKKNMCICNCFEKYVIFYV